MHKAAGKDARESYVRWQKVTGGQLGSVVKLVLTLTTAAIAFGANLVAKRATGTPVGGFYVTSLIILIAAAAVGLLVNVTRLMDFRWTTRAARMRYLRIDKRPIDRYRCPRWLKSLKSESLEAASKSDSDNLPTWLKDKLKNRSQTADEQTGVKEKETQDQQVWRTIGNYCKESYDFWGRCTWCLLVAQFVLFGSGVAGLAVAVMLYPVPSAEPVNKSTEVVPPPNPVKPNLASNEAPPATNVYTVLAGDSLQKIARLSYRNPARWVDIYQRNKKVVGENPSSLQPGQVLEIPD